MISYINANNITQYWKKPVTMKKLDMEINTEGISHKKASTEASEQVRDA